MEAITLPRDMILFVQLLRRERYLNFIRFVLHLICEGSVSQGWSPVIASGFQLVSNCPTHYNADLNLSRSTHQIVALLYRYRAVDHFKAKISGNGHYSFVYH